MSKWIEIDELEKTNNKLQQTNQKLDEINTKLDEINTKTNEINEKTTLIHDYFNKALNLEILASLFDILQKNYIKLTAHNIQPNDLITPHLYDLYFDGVDDYAVIGLRPDGSGTPFVVYGWNAMTVEELVRVDDTRIEPRRVNMMGDIWTDIPSTTVSRITYTPYCIVARIDARRTDGSRAIYQTCVSSWIENRLGHVTRVISVSPTKKFEVYANGSRVYSVNIPNNEVTLLEWNPNTATYPERYRRFVLGANSIFWEWINVRYSYIRIYSRDLSDSEIQQAYSQHIVNSNDLKVFIDPTFWDGSKYLDLSGNGNHAYPYNYPQRIESENKWIYIIRNLYNDGYVRFLLPRETIVIWNSGKITTIECTQPMFYDYKYYWCLYPSAYKGDSATIYIPQ